MILGISLGLFFIFVLFHLLYTFIPLYTSRLHWKVYPIKEKGMSILIPAYNEERIIENCLQALLNVGYANIEILFINDGSTDETIPILDKHLSLHQMSRSKQAVLDHELVRGIYRSEKHPHIWVIDKENGGKADALNTGIDFAKEEIIITLDADSMIEPNALKEINRTFAADDIVAAGGLVHIVQGFKQRKERSVPSFKIPGLIRYQVVQYLTAFHLHKKTQSKIGAMTVIAGAFGAFRRSVLIQANGYRKTVGEDMDITLRIQQLIGTVLKGKRIVFVPEAICYTECPPNFKSLYRQRIRWQKAFVDCVITYRKALYRKMNFRVSTYLLLDSLVLGTLCAYPTLMVPIIVLLTMNHIKLSLILLMMSVTLAIMQNIATIIVSGRFNHLYRSREYISIFLFLPLEVMLYRLTGLFFVTIGTILYFFDKDGWTRSERIGKPILLDTDIDRKTRETIGG